MTNNGKKLETDLLSPAGAFKRVAGGDCPLEDLQLQAAALRRLFEQSAGPSFDETRPMSPTAFLSPSESLATQFAFDAAKEALIAYDPVNGPDQAAAIEQSVIEGLHTKPAEPKLEDRPTVTTTHKTINL